MSEEKQNVISKLLQHALTTAIGVMVTIYITNSVNDKEHTEEQSKKEQQRFSASIQTDERIIAYENKLDSMTREIVRLRMQMNTSSGAGIASSASHDKPSPGRFSGGENPRGEVVSSEKSNRSNTVSAESINGKWITTDNTIKWEFNNGYIEVGGNGIYSGMAEGNGRYSAGAGNVTGSVLMNKYFYLPYNETVRFSLSMNNDLTALVGNLTDANGKVTPVVLYKK